MHPNGTAAPVAVARRGAEPQPPTLVTVQQEEEKPKKKGGFFRKIWGVFK